MMSSVLKILIRQCLNVFKMIFAGFILSKMWGWFIVSRFGLPPMDFKAAIGVLWVATFLQFETILLVLFNQSKNELERVGKLKNTDDAAFGTFCTVITIVFVYPFVLLLTYLWHTVLG